LIPQKMEPLAKGLHRRNLLSLAATDTAAALSWVF